MKKIKPVAIIFRPEFAEGLKQTALCFMSYALPLLFTFNFSLFTFHSFSQTVTWTGAVDNDWHKPCNWNTLAVPTCNDNVVIPSVTNKPTISATACAKTINPQTGAGLTIQSPTLLQIGPCPCTPTENTCPCTPNTWTQKADFANGTLGGRYSAVGFSIGTKGYIGIGLGSTYKDFWEYDPSNNTWTQKADFGGGLRYYSVGFSIGTKGYIGTGANGTPYKKDFWEYDPSNNTWTQKADFGAPSGTARRGVVGFSIGAKGYAGTGEDVTATYKKDFWEYDPVGNTWTQKTDFGGLEEIMQ
ncbi:MAG: hypothetical protein HY840_15355 [Bacteroidetes bacterium]|nr:hypothetical protein [Bacteroidota bacterium]